MCAYMQQRIVSRTLIETTLKVYTRHKLFRTEIVLIYVVVSREFDIL